MGYSVYFGPGPAFDAYICHDKDAFICHNGDTTKIHISNGVYLLPVREVFAKFNGGEVAAAQDDGPPNSGGASSSSNAAPLPAPFSDPLIESRGAKNGVISEGGELEYEANSENPPH